MPCEVVVVGQIGRDLILRVTSAPGAQQSTNVRERREQLGGKGANQAVGLAQLGMDVGLVGVVGDDWTAGSLLQQAHSDRIDVSGVARRKHATSALIVDIVDDDAHWHYLEHTPDDMLISEDDVLAAAEQISAASSVVVQLQQPAAAALTAARIAHSAGARVVLDGVAADADIYDYADVLRADANEAEQMAGHRITGPDDLLHTARSLLGCGLSVVVLELREWGNAFVSATGQELIPTPDVDVVDTTGGGDALVAGFTWALARHKPLRVAARLATAASSNTVQHPGGRPNLGAVARMFP